MNDWWAMPNDRMSLNGRPALVVRELDDTGRVGDPVAAVWMNRTEGPGLYPAEQHAHMIALTPRCFRLLSVIYDACRQVQPEDRSIAQQEACDIYMEFIGDYRDPYRGVPDVRVDVGAKADGETAAA